MENWEVMAPAILHGNMCKLPLVQRLECSDTSLQTQSRFPGLGQATMRTTCPRESSQWERSRWRSPESLAALRLCLGQQAGILSLSSDSSVGESGGR